MSVNNFVFYVNLFVIQMLPAVYCKEKLQIQVDKWFKKKLFAVKKVA